MRLIISALLLGGLSWLFLEYPAKFPLTFDQIRYGVITLCGYLLVEGILSLRSRSVAVRGGGAKLVERVNGLREEVVELSEAFKGSAGTIKSLREALSAAQADVAQKAVSGQPISLGKAVGDEQSGEESQGAPDALEERKRELEFAQSQVVSLLAVMQAKGRLVDFLMQDLTKYDDSRVAAVARFVHEGCQKVLREHLDISSVHEGGEGEQLTLEAGFNPSAYRLTGKVTAHPPYAGKVVHKGWQTKTVRLPRSIKRDGASEVDKSAPLVIAPAEVEVS